MIQRMGRVTKKNGLSDFIFFIPIWTIVKDQQEIKKRLNTSIFSTTANT